MKIGHFTNNRQIQSKATSLSNEDAGLRSYMQKIYAYMTAGLAITGSIAFFLPSTQFGMNIINSPASFIAMIAPIGIVLFLASRINTMKASTAQNMFWVLSACYGIFFASIFMTYTTESVARVFFISSSACLNKQLYAPIVSSL